MDLPGMAGRRSPARRRRPTPSTIVRHTALRTNLKLIDALLTILDKGGGRLDFATTERRARALASRLVERADKIASGVKH